MINNHIQSAFIPVFISTVSEHKKYNQSLHQLTIFPQVNTRSLSAAAMSTIVVSFRFRSINFSKKRALPFFLAIELLTHRKCIASLSSRNVQAWKIRKGRLVGCKVTLRKEGLDDFLNTLSLTFPRIEKRVPATGLVSNFISKYQSFIKLNKSIRGKSKNVSALIPRKLSSSFSLALNELVLFYPIELGLGLHPDVRQVIVHFNFTTSSIEERYFFLRQSKIPVSH